MVVNQYRSGLPDHYQITSIPRSKYHSFSLFISLLSIREDNGFLVKKSVVVMPVVLLVEHVRINLLTHSLTHSLTLLTFRIHEIFVLDKSMLLLLLLLLLFPVSTPCPVRPLLTGKLLDSVLTTLQIA